MYFLLLSGNCWPIPSVPSTNSHLQVLVNITFPKLLSSLFPFIFFLDRPCVPLSALCFSLSLTLYSFYNKKPFWGSRLVYFESSLRKLSLRSWNDAHQLLSIYSCSYSIGQSGLCFLLVPYSSAALGALPSRAWQLRSFLESSSWGPSHHRAWATRQVFPSGPHSQLLIRTPQRLDIRLEWQASPTYHVLPFLL